jgi:hypothetical protein
MPYLQRIMRAAPFMAALVICLPISWTIAGSNDLSVYDHEGPRDINTVLPAAMIKGEQWILSPDAIPYQGLFQFEIKSSWGDIPVYGEAMLRLRLRELRAISELQEISSTEAGLQGAGKTLKKSVERLGYAIVHPKRTAKDVPHGTRRLFGKLKRYGNKITEAMADDKEGEAGPEDPNAPDSGSSTQKAAEWLVRKYAGVGSKTRNRARDVGVDPYTRNELLAAELDRVASAEAVGSVTSKILLPAIAGGLGLMADAANIAYITDWRDVLKYNAQIMRGMAVTEENILLFQTHQHFTPMTQTLLIAMLDSINGAEGRQLVIEQAIHLENESEALFFLESVMLAEWYHRERTSLKKFVANTLIPVGVSEAGNLVAFTAADYFYWTEESEKVSRDFTQTYSAFSGGREFFAADYVSPRTKQALEGLGWSVVSGLRQTYDIEVPWGSQDHD